jgi:colanic acid/amylovoran biosynthesis protein
VSWLWALEWVLLFLCAVDMRRSSILLPKNIVISHVYSSDNKGDAALTSVLIDDLKRKFPAASVTILALESVSQNGQFEGVPERPGFMYYALNKYRNPLVKLVYTFYMVSATLAEAAWWRIARRHVYLPAHLREVVQTYEQADLIVPVGGGYIRSRAGLVNRMNIPLLLHPLLFGYLLGKPTVLYSQSVGPFQNRLEKLMVAFVFRRMTLVLAREDKSVKMLANMGVKNNVKRAIDSGFLLASTGNFNVRRRYNIPDNKLLVGVTVRSWLSGKDQVNYEKTVAGALDNIIDTVSAHVIFIPQVTAAKGDDDRVVSHRVHQLMHHPKASTVINDNPDHNRIKAIYDNLDALVGTRFHSVIFSLTSYVPVVAIEYEHKTSGIMHDLRLDEWVIKIEDVTAQKLTKLIHKLVHNLKPYQTKLKQNMPAYVKQAGETADMLADSYVAN